MPPADMCLVRVSDDFSLLLLTRRLKFEYVFYAILQTSVNIKVSAHSLVKRTLHLFSSRNERARRVGLFPTLSI